MSEVLSFSSLEATLDYQVRKWGELDNSLSQMKEELGFVSQDIQNLETQAGMVDLSGEFYKKVLDRLYDNSIGEIEGLLKAALKFIFFDREFDIRIDLEDKRGQSINFILIDNSENPPLELDIKDGTGMGVRTVISAVLHIFFLLRQKSLPCLFIDEAYSAVSVEYRERFFDFMRKLCKEKGMSVVLVTHDPSIIEYADQRFLVNDGRVTEERIVDN